MDRHAGNTAPHRRRPPAAERRETIRRASAHGLAPARNASRAIAAHLADLIQRARADGGANPDTAPQAAAWLLLSVLSARRIRAAAMPPGLEPAVAALALRALAPPPTAAHDRAKHHQASPALPFAPDATDSHRRTRHK